MTDTEVTTPGGNVEGIVAMAREIKRAAVQEYAQTLRARVAGLFTVDGLVLRDTVLRIIDNATPSGGPDAPASDSPEAAADSAQQASVTDELSGRGRV